MPKLIAQALSKAGAHGTYADFQLEILHGCRWSCSGCKIAKEDQDGFVPGDFDKLMRLFHDMKSKGMTLASLAIGPTDFMAANNFAKVMQPEMREMFKMFQDVVLNTTFLSNEETMVECTNVLRPLLDGIKVKFSTPIEPRHYKNPKYMDTLLGHRQFFLNLLPKVRPGKLYLIANLHEYKLYQEDPFQNDKITFEEYSEQFHNMWGGAHIDLVISDGRQSLKSPIAQNSLIKMLQYQNTLYNNSVMSEKAKKVVNFTYGKPDEGSDYDYVYKNGNLYTVVFVGEPLVLFEDDFCISGTKDWTLETLIQHEENVLMKSFDYVNNNADNCYSCEFSNRCVSRGLLLLMKNLGVESCMAPKPAFERVRQVA